MKYGRDVYLPLPPPVITATSPSTLNKLLASIIIRFTLEELLYFPALLPANLLYTSNQFCFRNGQIGYIFYGPYYTLFDSIYEPRTLKYAL